MTSVLGAAAFTAPPCLSSWRVARSRATRTTDEKITNHGPRRMAVARGAPKCPGWHGDDREKNNRFRHGSSWFVVNRTRSSPAVTLMAERQAPLAAQIGRERHARNRG